MENHDILEAVIKETIAPEVTDNDRNDIESLSDISSVSDDSAVENAETKEPSVDDIAVKIETDGTITRSKSPKNEEIVDDSFVVTVSKLQPYVESATDERINKIDDPSFEKMLHHLSQQADDEGLKRFDAIVIAHKNELVKMKEKSKNDNLNIPVLIEKKRKLMYDKCDAEVDKSNKKMKQVIAETEEKINILKKNIDEKRELLEQLEQNLKQKADDDVIDYEVALREKHDIKVMKRNANVKRNTLRKIVKFASKYLEDDF